MRSRIDELQRGLRRNTFGAAPFLGAIGRLSSICPLACSMVEQMWALSLLSYVPVNG